ncbi:MipA/OmpV family protein [Rhodoferax ferrireducens]|uniref:MipA/OmpV family protein n=1 Tax=Rhodoferax ferrireducens TaxID=192843 RepID=UPI0018E56A85|nr:MipA/OmpV family protein [Rhodoferax ferrireducens]
MTSLFTALTPKPVRTMPAALALLVAGTLSMASASAQTAGTKTTSPDQGTTESESGDSKWAIGVAGGINKKVYRDFDSKASGLPLLTFENKYVHVFGPGVDVKLPSLGPVSFRLRGRFVGEGYEASDSPFLQGMVDRDSSFWVGGAATWRTGIANLSAEVLGDAMGNSKGTRAKLQIDRRFAAGSFGFTPRLAAEWVDKKYVDYYYGVTPGEALAGRLGYQGESTVNTEIGMRIDWRVAPKHAVFLDMGATRMGSAITNSPLVEKDTQYGVGIGYFYRF